jgi:hypothetical protein
VVHVDLKNTQIENTGSGKKNALPFDIGIL